MENSNKYCSPPTVRKSVYSQIADTMRKDILNGTIPFGTQLLPEDKLAASFNVSLVTIQRTLKLLADEKLLVRHRRKGTFVSNDALQLLKYKNLGLIMPGLGLELTLSQSPTNYLIFDGIQKFCHENSWDIQIISKKNETFSLEKISKLNISGLIIVMPNKANYELIADLKKHQIPFLCINLHSEKINKDANFVNMDFYESTIDAVKYLYEKGRKNIAIVSIHEIRDDRHHFHIINGYKQAVKTLGLRENIITVENDEKNPMLIEAFFRTNLTKIKKYDAVITMDPNNAVSLFKVLNEEKIKIPEDISLLSFFENQESVREGITSYSPNLQALGYKSASLFNEILNDKNKKQLKIKLDLFPRLSA